MDMNFYLEENKMLRELAKHWELEYNKIKEDRDDTLQKYDRLVQETLAKEYNERYRAFDHIFKVYQYCIYPNRNDEEIDREDLVYAFSQWVQKKDAANLFNDMFGKEASKAIDDVVEGCIKWGEQ